VVIVLGNHDTIAMSKIECARRWNAPAPSSLKAKVRRLQIKGATLGIAGSKGFGAALRAPAPGPFGESEMKAFIHLPSALRCDCTMS